MQTKLDVSGTAPVDWPLDDRTRQVGRQGLAEARQALLDATRREAARRRAGQGVDGQAAA